MVYVAIHWGMLPRKDPIARLPGSVAPSYLGCSYSPKRPKNVGINNDGLLIWMPQHLDWVMANVCYYRRTLIHVPMAVGGMKMN